MRAPLTALFILLSFVATAQADQPSASARSVRFPASGNPAFTLEVSPGWSVVDDQSTELTVYANDRSGTLQLLMFDDSSISSSRLASEAMSGIPGAGQLSDKQAGTLAGYSADAFEVDILDRGIHVDCKLLVAKIDSGHYGVQVTLIRAGASDQQSAALKQLVASVKIAPAN